MVEHSDHNVNVKLDYHDVPFIVASGEVTEVVIQIAQLMLTKIYTRRGFKPQILSNRTKALHAKLLFRSDNLVSM